MKVSYLIYKLRTTGKISTDYIQGEKSKVMTREVSELCTV